jgi:arsenate reductase
MGEAFLRYYAGDHFEVYSAGFEAKGINPLTAKVMEEKGIPLTRHYSKLLNQYLGKKHFGITITVCEQAEEQCPSFPSMGSKLFWPFEDPASYEGTDEEKLEKFREVRDLIEVKVQDWLKSRNIVPLAPEQ